MNLHKSKEEISLMFSNELIANKVVLNTETNCNESDEEEDIEEDLYGEETKESEFNQLNNNVYGENFFTNYVKSFIPFKHHNSLLKHVYTLEIH